MLERGLTDKLKALWVDDAVKRVLDLFPGKVAQPRVLDLGIARDEHFAKRVSVGEAVPLLVILHPTSETPPPGNEILKLAAFARSVLKQGVIDCQRVTWLADLLDGQRASDGDNPAERHRRNPFYLLGEVVAYFNEESGLPACVHAHDSMFEVDAIFRACAMNLTPEDRSQNRELVFHGAEHPQRRLQLQVIDLCTALLLLQGTEARMRGPLRFLWIENKPDDLLAEVLRLPAPEGKVQIAPAASAAVNPPPRLRDFLVKVEEWATGGIHFYLISSDFASLHTDLLKHGSQDETRGFTFSGTKRIDGRDASALSFSDFHLFLIDIYLESQWSPRTPAGAPSQQVDGIALLHALERIFPGTPAVIISSTEDYEEIRRVFKNQGEYFLPKKQFLSLPLLFYRSIEELGTIVSSVQNDEMRAHLVSLLRRWGRAPGHLWFGDKCYHMIDHSLPHVLDDWKLFNDLSEVIHSNGWLEPGLRDEEIYLSFLAIWLHDIGHKGNERYGEAHQIRDNHGILSAEFILRHPRLLEIKEARWFKDPTSCPAYDSFYEGRSFPTPTRGWHVTRMIFERHRLHSTGLSTLEKAALLALYHKSNAPVSRKGLLRMEANGRHVPIEYAANPENLRGEMICLEDILDAAHGGDRIKTTRFLTLTAIFRLVDGLDVNKVRVGSASVGELKRHVLKQDLEQVLDRLKRQVELLISRIAPNDKALALQLDRQLLSEPTERIREGRFKLSSNDVAKIERLIGPQTDYWQILNFAAFISVQEGHFDLHGCVDALRITSEGRSDNAQLKFHFTLNRPYSWLAERKVGEMRREPLTLWTKLFGDGRRLPYAIEEFTDGFEFLRGLLKLDRGVWLELEFPGSAADEEPVSRVCRRVGGELKSVGREGWLLARRLCHIEI